MKTYFALPQRADRDGIRRQVAFANSNEILSGVLRLGFGLLAILNEHRQILAVNEAFLKEIGIEDAAVALGLRPGEAVGCVHAADMKAGCGTGKWCSTCGAAIAIVASLAHESPRERKCVITMRRKGIEITLCFSVRAEVITLDSQRFIFLYLQDITSAERRAGLERVFLHDIKNLITGLSCSVEIMTMGKEDDTGKSIELIKRIAERLNAEIAVQSALVHGEEAVSRIVRKEVSLQSLVAEAQSRFSDMAVSRNITFTVSKTIDDSILMTESSLLLRVLENMLTNAFEATEPFGEVKLSVETGKKSCVFYVWNKRHIPENVSRRVFQQYFSTKEESGRGFGTYSMKMIAEQFLGGTVDFTSSKSQGTIFRFTVPVLFPQEN